MSQTVLITGATGGIGLEFVKIFASKKATLLLVARNELRLRRMCEKLRARGLDADYVACDLGDPDSPAKIAAHAEQEGMKVDILINNAGFGDYGPFAEANLQKQLDMIDLNVRALTEMTGLFLPGMIARGSGKILNVGSIASFEPGPMMSVYYATKAFVLSFSEALTKELKGTGVTVTCLCPGPTNTGFTAGAGMTQKRFADIFSLTGPAAVASYGYKALMRGQAVAIHGLPSKIGAFGVRLLPRKAVRELVYRLQK